MGIATLTTPRLRPSAAGPRRLSRGGLDARGGLDDAPIVVFFPTSEAAGRAPDLARAMGVGADALIRPGVAGGQPYRALRIASAPRPRAQRPARCATRPIQRPIDLPCALSPKPQTDPSALRGF